MSSLKEKIISDLRVRGVMTDDPENREELVDQMLASRKVTVTAGDWEAAVLFQDSLFSGTPAKRAANLEALIIDPVVWLDVLAAAAESKAEQAKSYPGSAQWSLPRGATEKCIRNGCGAKVVERFHRKIRTDLNGRWVCPACGVEYFGGYAGGYPVSMWSKDKPLWLGTTQEECLPA